MKLQPRWLFAIYLALPVELLNSHAVAQETSPSAESATPGSIAETSQREEYSLEDIERLALEQNPQLAHAAYVVQASRGRATQAGVYPNPTVEITFDELGDRTDAAGINTLPLVTQEIVTAGKLQLNQEAALREVDQETWLLVAQRSKLLAEVRVAYYEALALQSRAAVLEQLVSLSQQLVGHSNTLLDAKQAARLDVLQLEIELEQAKSELDFTSHEIPAAYRNLAILIGNPTLLIPKFSGQLSEELPSYELSNLQAQILKTHPEIHAAKHGIERARLLAERARVERIPNIALNAGYVRQNQTNSDDFRAGASMTVPLWDRNQGNIAAANAQLHQTQTQLRRVEQSLAQQLATLMHDFHSASRRAKRYRKKILPRAKERYEISLAASKSPEFGQLRVIEAQRALAQANLEYTQALGESWQAAATISGLVGQEIVAGKAATMSGGHAGETTKVTR